LRGRRLGFQLEVSVSGLPEVEAILVAVFLLAAIRVLRKDGRSVISRIGHGYPRAKGWKDAMLFRADRRAGETRGENE
jgi:hypothetical protein